MPFVGEDAHPPGRKRRWSDDDDDDDERDVYALYAAEQPADFYVLNQHQGLAPRKIMPLTTTTTTTTTNTTTNTTTKRARIAAADDDDAVHVHDPSLSPPSATHRRRRSSQLRHFQIHSTLGSRPAPKPSSAALLTPCHICHRKPTKRSHLDSFAECQGCGERACFVCIRECHGWHLPSDRSVLSEQEAVLSRSFHMDDVDDMQGPDRSARRASAANDGTPEGWDAVGHRAVVCSRCCIERGAEGDVACLGCLSRMEGA